MGMNILQNIFYGERCEIKRPRVRLKSVDKQYNMNLNNLSARFIT